MSRTQVPASIRARILELRAKGCPDGISFDSTGRGSAADTGGKTSYRAIMAVLAHEGYVTTDVTVRAVVQEAEASGWTPEAHVELPRLVQVRGTGAGTGKGKDGGRPGQGTGGSVGTTSRELGGAVGDDQGGAVELPPLPEDATVAARVLYRDIRDSDRRLRELPNDADHASKYSAIARVKMQQVKALAALIPPSKPDPKYDPTNLAARELIRERTIHKVQGVFERARRVGFHVPGEL